MHSADYENFKKKFITTSYFIYDRMWSVRLRNYFFSEDRGWGKGRADEVELGCIGEGSKIFHKLYIILLCTSYFIMLVVVIKIWAWGENRGPCTMIEGFLGFFTPAFEQEKVCLYMFAHILNRSSILTWFYLYIYTLMRGSWKVFTREAGMGGIILCDHIW